MRTVVIIFGLVCLTGVILAQRVGIGTSTPDPSARLDVSDTLRGILIPRLTTAERNAITNPAHSLLIYNIDCKEYQYYIPGTGWVRILTNVTAGGVGSGTLIIASPATGIWSGGFTAHWSPVAGATSYEVRVYQDCGSSTVVATATFPAGSTSGPVSVSMACNQSRCYEVRATVSITGCGSTASLLISNRVPVTRSYPCTTPNTWVSLPAPPAAMQGRDNYVTIAHNGLIYVGFGMHVSLGCPNDWWRWDPSCPGTWTQLASPPVPFHALPFIFAIGPYIYVGGGGFNCAGGPINAFYRYDPANNSWTARANLPVPLHGAVGASDGTYGYVACGQNSGGNYTNTLYRYNPSTDSWTTLSTVPGPVRWIPSMTYYQGKLYIGGGAISAYCGGPGSYVQDFYAYDIATDTWTTLPNHPTTHYDAWAVAYNGKIYVTGEHSPCCCSCTNQYYYYDIASNTWSSMPVFPGVGRNNLKLVELNGVLYGGWGHACTAYIRDWWAFCP